MYRAILNLLIVPISRILMVPLIIVFAFITAGHEDKMVASLKASIELPATIQAITLNLRGN